MEGDSGVRRRSCRHHLCPSQSVCALDHGVHAGLGSPPSGQSRSRSARRRPSPLSARRERDDRGLAQQAARRGARNSAQGSHLLHRPHAKRSGANRVGEDPPGYRLRQGLPRPAQAGPAGWRVVRPLWRQQSRCQPEWRRRHPAQGDRRRPDPAHELGHPGLDRDHPPPRRRLRHHRAEHPAPGPQPRARAGSRHQRRRAAEEAHRRDRQARIQDGGSGRQCAAGGGDQAGSPRR